MAHSARLSALLLAIFLFVAVPIRPVFSSETSNLSNSYLNAIYEEWEVSND